MTVRHLVRFPLFVAALLSAALTWHAAAQSEKLDLQGRAMLETIDEVLCDTWFQRWFMPDAVTSATIADRRFREHLQRSSDFEAAARSIIAQRSIQIEKKRMAIYMMQCLPADRYRSFVRFVFEETRRGCCAAILVGEALYPGAHWGPGIALQYEDSNVRNLLSEIDQVFNDPQVRDRVSAIRDGSSAKYIQHLIETGDSTPLVRCEQ